MKLRARKVSLTLAETFTIARQSRDVEEVVHVELEHDGLVGYGEGAPVDYWGETPESLLGFLEEEAPALIGGDPFALEYVDQRLALRPGEQGAKQALDGALHDWVGKRLGQPVWRILGLAPTSPATSYTIGIDSVPGTVDRTRRAEGYRFLKVKVGGPDDLARLEAVRENSDARIRIDGNEGWTLEIARELMPRLRELEVEFVEQPFPVADVDSYRALRELPERIPVILDESVRGLADVGRAAGIADGINIKLAKSGGIREGLRMIHAARALDLQVMIGCMIESELGISQSAQIASLVDHVDLDGHLLISDAPFSGLGFRDGGVVASAEPGLGVTPA
ncbi:MAG TPA: dipeptide epimerase [Thermoleophilaceae bacterium]|nr:dipeptide epimerase [Thermoleophilaceae bacterium]